MEKFMRAKSLTNTEAVGLILFAFLAGRWSAHAHIALPFEQGRASGVAAAAPQLAQQVNATAQQQQGGYAQPAWGQPPQQQGQSNLAYYDPDNPAFNRTM